MTWGPPAYRYEATVLEVHDGDTIRIDVDCNQPVRGHDRDLGFHLHIEAHRLRFHPSVRLLGINAPELATPAGVVARDYLAGLLPVGTSVIAATHLDENDKYGRLLASIELPDGRDASQLMIDSGNAAAWDGHGPKPVPA